ncbi:putative Ig domain-containing protein [Janthinobacterium sp. MDB2-8]|uniref:putative Ig domain-containing protein n=1 Tax=Janthinobacterium sp. MDB2-8 TaxID=1259338 RepID=UPI003F1F2579
MLTLALGVSPAQAAGPSTECPPNQSFTVAAGGNHTIDLSGCTPFGFTGMPVPPSHGSIPNVAGNGTGIVVYTNNSDGATSDTFTLSDDLAGDIVFVVTILPPTSPITVTPASLPAPVIGVSYNQTISSSGGVAPYTYTLSSVLPAGMSLSSAGLISGTPTATGVFVFGAQITDSTTPTALTTTKNYSFTVAAPVLAITPASPAAGAVSQAYSQQFSTSGGTSAYTYVVESGSLPTGLNLSASGLLSGTPTGTGTFNFVLKSTDSTGGGGPYAKTISISLTINALPVPTVSSISPTTGPTTGGTSVIITGTNLTGATAVRFGATNATGFTVNSSTQITATAPAGTGTVDVRVTTSGGTSATSAADQFTYVAAPTVTSISPTSGPATGGTTVIISGTNFSGATAVTFGATAATGFSVLSATQITATAPAGSGTVDVRITTGGGTSATSAADQYTYIAAPTVSSISPTSGPATGSSSVIITGTNLSGATAVRFGGGNASGFTVNSATQITATAPAGTGTVDVTVITSGGTSATSAADQFTYLAAPTVSSISPASGPTAGGSSVTINGTNFGGVTAVSFGGTAASSFTFNSATQITATAPAGTGTVDVRVTTGGGTSAAGAADQFTYLATPTVSSISPTSGPAAGGTSVTITGTNFGGVTAVTFGGTAASSFTFNSPTQITATAPFGTGTVDVRVTTGGGTSATSAADQYTYIAAPTVSSISPSTGLTSGGTSVIITGANLSGATAVRFGGSNASGFTVNSATQITATAPAGVAGTVDVTVITGGGTSAISLADKFTYVAAPTISVAPSVLPAISTGTAYSQTITATGGATSYSFAVSGSLPAGLSFNSSTGVLSGTPTTTGAYNFTITATDSSGSPGPYTGSRAFSGTVTLGAPVAGAVSATVPYGSTNNPITLNLSGGAAVSVAVASGALHGTATAVGTTISYTPTAAYSGSDSFTYTVMNGTATSAAATVTITVSPPTISVAPSVLPAISTGTAYSQTISASGGVAPYSFSVSGSLPAGLTLAANGVLSGTPTTTGAYNFTITATDSSGSPGPYTSSRAFGGTVTLGAPVAGAVSATVPYGSTNNPITLNLSGGAAVAVSVASGALHGTATAVGTTISYTPTAAYSGSDSFTYTVMNGTATSAAATVTITVSPPTISVVPSVLPAITASNAYSQTISASGGVAPYSFSVIGSLPSGLTLAANGVLSGTPTATGAYSFTVTATDNSASPGPYTASRAYSGTVAAPTIAITPGALAAVNVGIAYSRQLTASGGVAPYAYTVSAGSLPAGLTLNGSGLLSGTPTASGSFSFTVQAADAHAFTSTQSYTLVVSSATVGLTPATLANPTAEAAYSATLTAAGGTAPYTFSVTSGSLPVGLSLNTATGVLSGTTNVAGSFTFSLRASDSSTGVGAPFSVTNSYTVSVGTPTIAITPATLAAVTAATAYSRQLTASGGVAPYAYTVSGGSLPAGLTLNGSGLLSGTPTASGSFSFTVQAADAHAFTGTQSYTLVVSSATVGLTPATLANPTAEAPYSAGVTAAGGTAPYTFSVSSGSLPAGLSLNAATGVLSGTTNVAGSFTFSLRASDSSTGVGAPFSATNSYTVSVASPTITVTPATLPAAIVATAYSQQLTASGGVAPYAYTVSSGSLPAGLTLSSSGLLSGTPTAGGSFTLTVQAADAHLFTGTQSYTLVVSSATVSLTPGTLANPTAEAAYSATLTAAGGTAPYTFSVSSGSLPTGLSLNAATGVLSGTTNVAGSFTFSLRASDSSTGTGAPFSATNSYTVTIAAPALSLAPGSLAAIRAGDAYSQQFTAAGGIAPYAYSVSSGALPAGLVLNAATGIISGTPTVFGSFSFTVQAADAHLFTVQQALTLQVNQAPPPVPNETATTSANQDVSLTIASTDGSPITDVTIVTPPKHGRVTVVSSGAAGGGNRAFKVTYVPNADYFGPDAFSYTATGPGGTSAPATVSLTVAPQPVPVPVAKTATVLAGTPVTLHVTEGATGGPFTAVAITTQPASGTAAVSGMDIIYTPGINTSGDISIGYTLSNVFGTSAPVKSTISVNPMPQVASQSATVVAGLTVTVDLTAGATGGPFTAANVLSVTPAEAGKAVVRDVGTAGKPSYQLSFAASGKFAGAAVVSYTLSNAYATSKPGVVNVTVTARRDPSVDPEVIGLQAAQADAARRFASAQLSNFTQRLESLHGDGWGRSSFGLSLTPPNDSGNPTAALARWQEQEADRVFGTAVKPFMRKAALRQPDTGFSSDRVDVSQATNGLPDMPQRPDTQKQALSLWLGGAVDFGQHYVNGRDTGFRFRTNGVSVGGDYRLSDLATLGVGAGFSHDSSDVGQNGSRSTADSAVAAVYGSLRPSKGVFLDGVLGYGTLQYDASRYLSDGSGFATGDRDGKQVFGAVVGGIEMRHETWMWSPYGRVELMSAKLDPYTEKATGINALSYFKQTVRSRIGALGVRAEGLYVGGLGTWFPRARLEYRHQFQGADDARLAYADLAADGPVYVIRTLPQQTGNWTAGLGVKLLLSNGMTITLDYNSNLNIDSGRTQSVMFGIAMPLK